MDAILGGLVHLVAAVDGVLELGVLMKLLTPLPRLEVMLKVDIPAVSQKGTESVERVRVIRIAGARACTS